MKTLRNRRWLAALVAVALLVSPVFAVAQSSEEIATEEISGIAKFLDYALCAVSIAAASTGAGAAVAVVTCAKAMHTWWSE